MDILEILLWCPGWIIVGLFLIVLFAAVIVRQIDKKKGRNPDTEKIITTSTLHAELNEERKRRSESSMPTVNPMGSTNTLARRDKSFSSSIDFFIKLFKRKKDQ